MSNTRSANFSVPNKIQITSGLGMTDLNSRVKVLLGAAIFIGLGASVVFAQTGNASGAIDLRQVIHDIDGNPVPNVTKRELGIVVLVDIKDGDKLYKAGDKIIDSAEARHVTALARALRPAGEPFAVGPIDPDCANCQPVTLGWVLSEALVSRACPPQQAGQAKPLQCTPDEEKAEADVFEIQARFETAKHLRNDPKIVLGPKSIGLLRDLVAVRFANSPTIVGQVTEMLGGYSPRKKWGEE